MVMTKLQARPRQGYTDQLSQEFVFLVDLIFAQRCKECKICALVLLVVLRQSLDVFKLIQRKENCSTSLIIIEQI